MKILFNIWNALMLVGASVKIILSVLAILGVGSLGAGLIGGGFLAGLALILLIATLSTYATSTVADVLTFIAAKAGISEDYDKCAKFGMIVLVLNLIEVALLIVQSDLGFKEAMSVIASGIHVFLAKRMQTLNQS